MKLGLSQDYRVSSPLENQIVSPSRRKEKPWRCYSVEYYAAVKMNKVPLYTPVWTILTHVTLNRTANCRRTHTASFHLYEVQNQAEPNNTVVYFCNIGKKYTDYKLKFRKIVTSLEEKWCWGEQWRVHGCLLILFLKLHISYIHSFDWPEYFVIGISKSPSNVFPSVLA